MESNPIQQRIVMLADKWHNASRLANVTLVRIMYNENESDMIDTFFNYMLGLEDCVIDDIPFLFNDFCIDAYKYSDALLATLIKNINVWNQAEKSTQLDAIEIQWQADYSYLDKKNVAALFERNMRDLTVQLDLSDKYKSVVILNPPIKIDVHFKDWIINLLRISNNSPQLQYLVADKINKPSFNDIQAMYPSKMVTINADLNMEKALEQVASMGDPAEPSTSFRQYFIKMTHEMGKKNNDGVYKNAASCIEIIKNNEFKDSYWLTQSIVIYSATSNYELGYKNYKKAIHEIDKAILSAQQFEKRVSDEVIANKYLGQVYMQKATIYYAANEWDFAVVNYQEALDKYNKGQEPILSIEASRMLGIVLKKAARTNEAIKVWADGVQMANLLPQETIISSTYTALIELLIQEDYNKVISDESLEQILVPIYGSAWRESVKNWKKIPALDIINH